jgi:hypothetical protein
MIKNTIAITLMPAVLAGSPAADVFYELCAPSPYTDHLPIFKKLFDGVQINSMIEFGIGLGTQYFVLRCPRVTSVEILDSRQNDAWFYSCVDFIGPRAGWNPILYRGSPAFTWANDTARAGYRPSQIDPGYIPELKNVVLENLSDGPELGFVDAGVHNRSDLVEMLFGHVDIICAHDTNGGGNVYGWDWIKTPSEYEKIVFRSGQGVTFWIKKTRMDVIRSLRS